MFCCPLRSSSARSWASASATRSPPPRRRRGCGWAACRRSGIGRRTASSSSSTAIVRSIFRCYAERGSVRLLKDELEARRIDSRSWTSASGRLVGGKPFLTRRALPDFAEPYLSRIRIAGNKAASSRSLTSADCGYACQKPEASSARRETTLQREIAVKNVSLGIFDPARCRRNHDFLGGFPPKPRSVLRNRQGIPRLSRVSSRAREGKPHGVRLITAEYDPLRDARARRQEIGAGRFSGATMDRP